MKQKSFQEILSEKLTKSNSSSNPEPLFSKPPYLSPHLFGSIHSVYFAPFSADKIKDFQKQQGDSPFFEAQHTANTPKGAPAALNTEEQEPAFDFYRLNTDQQSAWRRLNHNSEHSLTLKQAKKMFRLWAKRLHPDHNPLWDQESYSFIEMRSDYLSIKSILETWTDDAAKQNRP